MRTGTRLVATLLVVALCTLSGCGLFSGRESATPITPERTSLKVGVGSAMDTAPLRIAVADGSFARAGLRIELVEQPSHADGLAKLASGELDVAFGSDTAIFKAAAGGQAGLQLQGEAYTSAAFTMALVTLPGSKYTDPGGKKAPVIAVDTMDDLGTLAARSMLVPAGVDPAKISFIQRPFEQMPQALRRGDADAALLLEPFITKAGKELGARILVDSARGATLNFPMSGYVANGAFAQANPHTLALFRQVLSAAQQQAADPATVRQALPSIAGIDETTAALVALGSYPTSLNGVRLQRVADLMHSSGLLTDRLDVQSMLPPKGNLS
ncbi:ABC transporter substrate-binding protein [Amycolatopsis nigrescens]|uniref:ABC transporter substrate-binding protein n=1 Tax=Amycolatopsis nigrescens TaxID=381445 RepID=UPI00036FB81B|nr:ABC transporter substrate-binding protein [Amycolatopsis nigrescens]